MPSVASFLFDENGTATDQIVEHYKHRAAGGPAAIIIEACSVSSNGFVSPHQGRIYHDKYIEGLSKIAAAIKAEGCLAGLQLHHSGRQTSPKVIKSMPVGPSNLVCPTINKEVQPLSKTEIKDLVKQFGQAAKRAILAGFDFLEVHGAHGYLINQFLSAFSNIRSDEYGGTLYNRTRFAKEVIREVRSRIPKEIVLSFKISAQEFIENGSSTTDSISVLEILIKEGLDLVQVSAGNDTTPEWIVQPIFMEPGCLTGSAAAIKKAIKIPTMVVGRINDPYLADKISSTFFQC
ncbi:MAG: hypothetical protein DRH26_11185 [Deltaproteobacteria bacterium]|nr:MAG: hypothetical protein DRH26_11185 [Deltaproteobacteria bacterium]